MERRLNIGRGHVSQHRPPGVGCAGTALQLGLLDGEKKSVLQSTVDGRQLQPPTQFHRSRVTPFSNEQLASASSDDNVNESDSPNESGRARPRGWTVEGQGRRADRSTRWTHALSISADFCGVSRIKRTSKRPLFPLVILAQIPQLIYFDCAHKGAREETSRKGRYCRAGHMKLGTLHAAHAAAAAAHRRRVSAASSPAAAEERAGRALFPLGDARTKWEKEVRQ